MRGARILTEELKEAFKAHQSIVVEPVPCVGRCEHAPIAVIGQRPLHQASVKAVIDTAQAEEWTHPCGDNNGDFDPVECLEQSDGQLPLSEEISPAWVGLDCYRLNGGYQLLDSVRASVETLEQVLVQLKDAALRGLGGAGFPAGRKWSIVRQQPAPRLLVVNLDEGEPGTFKDRTYLERDPHRFLEGLLVAATAVGIERCYIYLRDEYAGGRTILQRCLSELIDAGLIEKDFIELRRGAGAYICGEESALIESIEGHRGEPRHRPPYVAEKGLFERPTLVHNFETLYWVRDIVQRGAQWWNGFGLSNRLGLRSFSVSGRVRHPGVKLAPAGITLNELIEHYCGGMVRTQFLGQLVA